LSTRRCHVPRATDSQTRGHPTPPPVVVLAWFFGSNSNCCPSKVCLLQNTISRLRARGIKSRFCTRKKNTQRLGSGAFSLDAIVRDMKWKLKLMCSGPLWPAYWAWNLKLVGPRASRQPSRSASGRTGPRSVTFGFSTAFLHFFFSFV
jgi:hypothetical protein